MANWTRVEDGLPPFRVIVLVWARRGDANRGDRMYLGHRVGTGGTGWGWWFRGNVQSQDAVTHWAPAPPPPEVDRG